VVLAAILAVSHPLWLGAVGRYLVRAEQPSQAEMVVVLAGDTFGHRILKGAELVRQGFAPRVLVSGPAGHYGFYESDLAIAFATRQGFSPGYFIALPNSADSTREEAAVVLAELRRRNIHRFLIVTSDYHTHRAGDIFRAQARGMEFRVVAAPDEYFRADTWWCSRPGRKVLVLECMKTVSEWIGL
jgi:uncharacterized SAM-binding protein YcdF (DUF218 family)